MRNQTFLIMVMLSIPLYSIYVAHHNLSHITTHSDVFTYDIAIATDEESSHSSSFSSTIEAELREEIEKLQSELAKSSKLITSKSYNYIAPISNYSAPEDSKMQLSKNPAIDEMIVKNGNDMPTSIRILFDILLNHETSIDDLIDTLEKEKEEKERCLRYGFNFNATAIGRRRRRIFFGSLIADDSWHAIGIHAVEAHGLYHTVALIESNTTQMMTRRETRFVDGDNPDEAKTLNRKLLQSNIFGPKTNVTVDYFIGDGEDVKKHASILKGTLWEHMQRKAILKIWKENGMTEQDIGIVSDIDEMFTRDFLLAAQTCDIEQFRPGQDCKSPKIIASTVSFECSPNCVKERRWYHPDMIIGECIETIGDSEALHTIPAKREFKDTGCRRGGHGKSLHDYDKSPLNETHWSMYPLWSPADFRCVEGGSQVVEISGSHTGFHFHNFFDSTVVLRNKYKTYGHAKKNADKAPLGSMLDGDLNLVLKCALNQTNGHMPYALLNDGNFQSISGQHPILLRHAEYRDARHKEVKAMLEADALEHGTGN